MHSNSHSPHPDADTPLICILPLHPPPRRLRGSERQEASLLLRAIVRGVGGLAGRLHAGKTFHELLSASALV